MEEPETTKRPERRWNPGGYKQKQIRYIMAALNYVPALTMQWSGMGVTPYTVEHLICILHANGCHIWKDALSLRARLYVLEKEGMVQRVRVMFATGNRFQPRRVFACWFIPGRAVYDLGVVAAMRAAYADNSRPDPVAVAMSSLTVDAVLELQRWHRLQGLPDPFGVLPNIQPFTPIRQAVVR